MVNVGNDVDLDQVMVCQISSFILYDIQLFPFDRIDSSHFDKTDSHCAWHLLPFGYCNHLVIFGKIDMQCLLVWHSWCPIFAIGNEIILISQTFAFGMIIIKSPSI